MHIAGIDIADEWPSLYLATTPKRYAVPEVRPVTVNCVVVTSPEFKKALEDNHVVLVRWRDLQKLALQP